MVCSSWRISSSPMPDVPLSLLRAAMSLSFKAARTKRMVEVAQVSFDSVASFSASFKRSRSIVSCDPQFATDKNRTRNLNGNAIGNKSITH